MKKSLFLSLAIICFCISNPKAMAIMESNTFLQNLETCTSYTPSSMGFDGTIVGITNGKCHVKYGNATLTNEKTQEQIKINNCYFPTYEIKKLANSSREANAFFVKYLGQSSIPSSEKAKMEVVLKENFYTMKKYCN